MRQQEGANQVVLEQRVVGWEVAGRGRSGYGKFSEGEEGEKQGHADRGGLLLARSQ